MSRFNGLLKIVCFPLNGNCGLIGTTCLALTRKGHRVSRVNLATKKKDVYERRYWAGSDAEAEALKDSDYLSLFVQISELYTTDFCQISESFAKSVNLK